MILRSAVFCLCFLIATAPSGKAQDETNYVVSSGFIYPPDKIPDHEIYEEGVWGLYYYLEQNISIAPELRNFLKGNLMVLFRIGFDNQGEIESVTSEENYLWYNIDNWGKPVVQDFITAIKEAPGWKKNYKGEVFFPVRFRTAAGRIGIDYNFFMLRRGVFIGEK